MQEFMLLVRNEGERLAALSPDQRLQFVKKCEVYIGNLKKEGKLMAAEPLVREGRVISGTPASWKDEPINEKRKSRLATTTSWPMILKTPSPWRKETLNLSTRRQPKWKYDPSKRKKKKQVLFIR